MTAGRKNIYVCGCGHATTTVELVDGTTPFMIDCREPGCQEMAQSQFGNVCQDLEAEWEWYRPGYTGGLSEAQREHVRMGGLLLKHRDEVVSEYQREEPEPEYQRPPVYSSPQHGTRTTGFSKFISQSTAHLAVSLGIGKFEMSRLTRRHSGNAFQPCDLCEKPTRGTRCFKCSNLETPHASQAEDVSRR